MKFLEQLKEICDKYDAINGRYPESDYEGANVYQFARIHMQIEEKTGRQKYTNADVE
jgi:hypothetical protein